MNFLFLSFPSRPSRKDGADVGRNSCAARDEATYRKLLDLLESSTSYRADRMLGRLPSEDMYEVRAILLGRLGRHEGALSIYVYQLEDHKTAEQCVPFFLHFSPFLPFLRPLPFLQPSPPLSIYH